MNNIGINLTGGGSRGAYQAGVLLALSEYLEQKGLVAEKNPLRYWTGVSAGSINQAYATAGMDNLRVASRKLTKIWASLEPGRIYRTDLWWLGQNSAKWIRDLSFGSSFKSKLAKSLLDTSPLYELLSRGVKFSKIQENIDAGYLDGLACSTYSYRDNRTVSFVQSKNDVGWDRPKRYSVKASIGVDHVMASCAIPILFPSVSLDDQYMADGSFRCTAPMSPLVHLGAQKIFMVGVRGPQEVRTRPYEGEPHLAKVAGLIMNALFFDNIDLDVERIEHLNELVRTSQNEIKTDRSEYQELDLKIIRPSVDIAEIAEERAKKGLPKTVSFLLAGLGRGADTAELASYILFESEFTKTLIDLGYQDFQKRRDEIISWLEEGSRPA